MGPKKLAALRAAVFTLSGKRVREGVFCPPRRAGLKWVDNLLVVLNDNHGIHKMFSKTVTGTHFYI